MRYRIYILMIALFLMGCGGGKSSDPEPVGSLEKAILTFPDKDAVCTTGTITSNGQSAITFTWNAAKNAEVYDIIVKNLVTNTLTSQTVTGTQVTIILYRNTPYSWYVISRSNKSSVTGAISDTWKFYNSGPAIISYPPFPADLRSPFLGQNLTPTNGTINFTWESNDVDRDIVSYAVYLGITSPPVLLKANVTDTFLNNVTVAANTTYYWKVITKDAAGNTSESIINTFKTL